MYDGGARAGERSGHGGSIEGSGFVYVVRGYCSICVCGDGGVVVWGCGSMGVW